MYFSTLFQRRYPIPVLILFTFVFAACADPVRFQQNGLEASSDLNDKTGGSAAQIVYECMNATITSAGVKWSYHVPQIMNLMNSIQLQVNKSETGSSVNELIGTYSLNKIGTDTFSNQNLVVKLRQVGAKKSIQVQHGSLGLTIRPENGWCRVHSSSGPPAGSGSPTPGTGSVTPSSTITFEGTKQVSIGVTKASELSPKVRAFLDMIAAAEGTSIMNNPCGNMDYGYASLFECYRYESRRFSSYSDHPRQFFTTSWGSSTDAAGRYQFQAATWDEVAYQEGLSDFSPANQDRATVNRLKSRGAYSFISQMQVGASADYAFKQALDASACEWASLPAISGSANHRRTVGGMPSCYGQVTHHVEDLYQVFKAAYAHYR